MPKKPNETLSKNVHVCIFVFLVSDMYWKVIINLTSTFSITICIPITCSLQIVVLAIMQTL